MVLNYRISSVKSLFLVVLCFTLRVFGQLSTATLLGTVQDSSKASIPDAELKLINTQTGTENDTITNAQGGSTESC